MRRVWAIVAPCRSQARATQAQDCPDRHFYHPVADCDEIVVGRIEMVSWNRRNEKQDADTAQCYREQSENCPCRAEFPSHGSTSPGGLVRSG